MLGFNPPWNSAVKTNVGKQLLRLIDTSFPIGNPLRKLLNRNTVKVSYKCMPNMRKAIARHNCQVLKKKEQEEEPAPGDRKSTRLNSSH